MIRKSSNFVTFSILGGSDKMQNSDFVPTHKTGGAKHKINDFCFLDFFIKTLQMSCASELKPYINNNEDR